jgi:hypothetical protein
MSKKLGLHYMGSKRKLSKSIIEALQRKQIKKYFIMN